MNRIKIVLIVFLKWLVHMFYVNTAIFDILCGHKIDSVPSQTSVKSLLILNHKGSYISFLATCMHILCMLIDAIGFDTSIVQTNNQYEYVC